MDLRGCPERPQGFPGKVNGVHNGGAGLTAGKRGLIQVHLSIRLSNQD